MTGPGTARERGRRALVADITATARRHLAQDGPAGLSLRAVSRELGLASSAVYRYFPSRDALLTALVVEAYDALGAVAEQAAGSSGEPAVRWLAVCRAVRGWAREHPHEWALLYGTPVPGYAAPALTIDPATRLSRVLAGLLVAAAADGSLTPPGDHVPPLVTARVLEVTGTSPTADYPDAFERGVMLVAALVGAVSYELFGHLQQTVTDPAAFFDASVAVAARSAGLAVPL